MSLTAAFQIGRSALSASSLALQVTGNNFANAATPGYSRQLINLAGIGDARSGSFLVGRGVGVQGINRQIDAALQARHWAGLSGEGHAGINFQVLSQMEATINELSDNDLSSEFGRFFDAWSELSNSPGAEGARSLVVQQGRTLASSIRALRSDLNGMRSQIDQQLDAAAQRADTILSQIADINGAILDAEGGGTGGQASNLRDQRDQLIAELSTLMDVSAIEQPSGAVNILVGSTPVVLGSQSRGVELVRRTVAGRIEVDVQVKADNTRLSISSGAMAGLIEQRGQNIDATIERLDEVASQLIFQVNRVHSAGHGSSPLTSIRGTQSVAASDQSLALNNPANSTFANLPFAANTGSFLVTVTNTATGQQQTVRVDVDLDGINAAGQPGFGDDTSVASLAADLNGISNLSATVNPDGTLSLSAASGYHFEFAEDTSGALAVLGLNTYFTGSNGADIDVRSELVSRPELLATGWTVNGQPSDNGAALAILGLRESSNSALGGRSIAGAWLDTAQSIGAQASSAANRADAASLVRQSLEAQQAAVSGVSLDEESINLMNFQRQYQGAARFISVIDQLTQELLSIV